MQPSVLQRYGEARLPRYTSYPPSPEFSPTVGSETYGDWLSRLPPDALASLYLHVPFCRSMCWYCGCHTTITAKDQPVIEYLRASQEVEDMFADICAFLDHWLEPLARNHRSYVTVAIGCTGGQHRSVYLVEKLAEEFATQWTTLKRHREVGSGT